MIIFNNDNMRLSPFFLEGTSAESRRKIDDVLSLINFLQFLIGLKIFKYVIM